MNDNAQKVIIELNSIITKLEAQLAESRKDAERYHDIKSRAALWFGSPDDFEKAIDAAMKGEIR